jgi:hypothetical protein
MSNRRRRAEAKWSATLLLTMLILGAALSLFAETPNADYPANYRRWAHIKSALIGPASPAYKRYGGIHHIYANEVAIEGYRSGHFNDGAVIVFDLLEAHEEGGTTGEGPRKFIDVMLRDSGRFASTGGWGFLEFRGDSKTDQVLSEETRNECYKCHAARKDADFVFSALRE